MGKTTKETQDTIRVRMDDKRVRVGMIALPVKIGPLRLHHARLYDAAGRAVWAGDGSKNLKAIAVRGHKPRIW